MFIYLPVYARGYDFCFYTLTRCLVSPTRHFCMHTQGWSASWKQNLTPNHSERWGGISASASLLMIFSRKRDGDLFQGASLCTQSCTRNHILYMIRAIHVWQLECCAKAIHTLSKCFSHFLLSCAKGRSEEEMHNWVRETEWTGGRKALKLFLLFVAEPRSFFFSPLSFPFHDIVCFL